MFAHSMGTIISRAFLQTQSREYHKAVLSGYPNPNGAAGAGILLTDVLSAFKGGNKKSKMVDNMVLGPFSKAVPNAKSPLEWLSYNPENVKHYAEDPLCGEPFTLGSYNALFHLIKMMDAPGQYKDVWGFLPILLISGKDDPCTGGERGRQDSLNRLKEAGFKEIRVETIEKMRHEILNEAENQKVFRMIKDFYNEQ
jgi:alpha-beta hydrolase superfamily lysophospholipase